MRLPLQVERDEAEAGGRIAFGWWAAVMVCNGVVEAFEPFLKLGDGGGARAASGAVAAKGDAVG